MSEPAKCQICGEPMPVGEEMFNYHGYSGPCPKPPLVTNETPAPKTYTQSELDAKVDAALALRTEACAEHVWDGFNSCSCGWRFKGFKGSVTHSGAIKQWQAHIRSLSTEPECKALEAKIAEATAELRKALQAVVDWEEEYRAINNLGKVPPSPFHAGRALLGRPGEAGSRTESET